MPHATLPDMNPFPALTSLINWVLFLVFLYALAAIVRHVFRLVGSGSSNANATIADVDAMTGQEFEIYLRALFTKLGYTALVTRYQGDGGADLVVETDSIRTIVQAKRWKKQVGVRVIGEILRARANYDCESAIIVTNSGFTQAAMREAKLHDIALWGRATLIAKQRQAGVVQPVVEIDSNPPMLAPEVRSQAKDGSWGVQQRHRELPTEVLGSEPQEARMALDGTWYDNSTQYCLTDSPGHTHVAESPAIAARYHAPQYDIPNITVRYSELPAVCALCGAPASAKVRDYCAQHLSRFNGQVFCYKHQRSGRYHKRAT